MLKYQLNKLNYLFLLIATSLTACGSGSSSGGTGGGGGDGSDTSLNVQSVVTISSTLNSTYNASCLYEYGNVVFIINADGSGSGYSLNLANGETAQVNGLPQINQANDDQCLSNYQQLTWINSSNPYIVNVYDPDRKQTVSSNLIQSGISASDIFKTSFNLSGTTLYASSLFNGSFGFSKFFLPDPTGYAQLDNSLYINRDISNVLYGFDGAGSQFLQLLPASGSLPAAIVSVQIGSGLNPVQSLSTITDTNNQSISAMGTAWDFTAAGNGVVVTTGAVQPVIYKCPLVAAHSYQCDKTYSGSEFVGKYRIMRLLGGNTNFVYFLGMNLTKADIEIFSMKL